MRLEPECRILRVILGQKKYEEAEEELEVEYYDVNFFNVSAGTLDRISRILSTGGHH